jgi:hypothetical protein
LDYKLEFLRTLNMKRGDGKTYEIQVKNRDTGEPIDLSDFKCKFIIKEYDKIANDDSTALLSSGEADIIDETEGIITIKIPPEDSINFPITKEDKPLVLAVQISNKDLQFSEEFHFAILVGANVFRTIY